MKNQYITTFIYLHPNYFFTNSEIIDYQIGRTAGHSFNAALNLLETKSLPLDAILSIFSYLLLHHPTNKNNIIPDAAKIDQAIQQDCLKSCISAIFHLLTKKNIQKQSKKLQSDQIDLAYEMKFKGLFNIIYIILYHIYTNSDNQLKQKTRIFLKGLIFHYVDIQIDDLLMKIIGLSLQVHYIPMKKLTMLYTIVLYFLFSQNDYQSTIYSDQQIRKLPSENLLRQDYMSLPEVNQKRQSPIQQFYRKHNMNECPLAQFVVVGLLRSLLTICNSHTHKKFATVQGSGVDAFRQWQISYNYALERLPQLKNRLSQQLIQKIQEYRKFNQSNSLNQCSESSTQSLFRQFYQHKIYTTSAITSFFAFLLLSFKKNLFIQYSYFLQLISDANGILVFLKFLTDKFQNLDTIGITNLTYFSKDTNITFKDEVSLTIYSVLSMLYTSCNNYPQKIRNFLFEYNSYLIIKKIPRLFFHSEKSSKQEDQQMLPSQQDLQNPPLGILPQLTQLCYDLLKIQIPFFSKKMKQNNNNIKMIVEIYCRYPKKVQPIVRTSFDKILLKNKVKNKQIKYITLVEDLKNVHNQFNNQQYWQNDFIIPKQKDENQLAKKISQSIAQPQIDVKSWLQENVWRYYD